MKVLKVNQKFFLLLGIGPTHDRTLGWLAVLILGSVMVSSLVGVINYGTTEFSKALDAILPTISSFRVFVTLILMILFWENVSLFFENLQTAYDQSK